MLKVAHLTSAHPRFDIRIFLKQCRSLASAGYDVNLVVADGKGDEIREEVQVFDVGVSTGRIDRIINTTRRVYEKAVSLDADIYHLHDPELMPIGLRLKRRGKLVIFDAHEDLPKQILGKPYLNWVSKFIVSKVVSIYERFVCAKFDAVISATPIIRDKFLSINNVGIDINNFPMLGELSSDSQERERLNQICYVGGVTQIRGIREVVQAINLSGDTSLKLVGPFSDATLYSQVCDMPGWTKVDAVGVLGRDGVRNVMCESMAGLVTFLPVPNHIDAQPNKMFEYMSAGLPVIASHFPLWREIIEGNDCGICVDPENPQEIASAIDFIASNPVRAKEMGMNGMRAVAEKYNWSAEEKKLIGFYSIVSQGI